MGANQSDSNELEDLKHKYGILKHTNNEITQRLHKLDLERASIDQQFQKQHADFKNTIDGVKSQLRELRHEHDVRKQQIDEDFAELKQRQEELQQGLSEIKISEIRLRQRPSFVHRTSITHHHH